MRAIYGTTIILAIILCILQRSNGSEYRQGGKKSTTFSPVILIPGAGGNRLQAKLNKPSAVNILCWKTSDEYDIWLNPSQMVPILCDCWVDNIKLTYDNVTRTTRNTPGVEIIVSGGMSTTTMEWIDTTPIVSNYDFGAYFTFIVEALVYHGYVRDANLFGAPYDFRKGPNENRKWFLTLEKLTKFAFETNNNTRVTFICHSMGGRLLLKFLQQMPSSWKDNYVEKIITLSTPWGGSVRSLQAILVGYDFGSNIIPNYSMMQVQRSCPSIVWLLPSKYFWKPDEVLAFTKLKNYTINNIDELFYDIGNPNAVEMRKDLTEYDNFTAPGVEVHCLYGQNVNDSVERLDFGDSVKNPTPTLILGNGDGTVNERSLIGCQHWRNTKAQGNHMIYIQNFTNVEHYNTLADARVINYILNQLLGIDDYLNVSPTQHTNTMKIRIF